jgi:hypothetical protein
MPLLHAGSPLRRPSLRPSMTQAAFHARLDIDEHRVDTLLLPDLEADAGEPSTGLAPVSTCAQDPPQRTAYAGETLSVPTPKMGAPCCRCASRPAASPPLAASEPNQQPPLSHGQSPSLVSIGNWAVIPYIYAGSCWAGWMWPMNHSGLQSFLVFV